MSSVTSTHSARYLLVAEALTVVTCAFQESMWCQDLRRQLAVKLDIATVVTQWWSPTCPTPWWNFLFQTGHSTTADGIETQLVTEGLTDAEKAKEKEWQGRGYEAKKKRQADFPLAVLELGYEIEVATAEASVVKDKTLIINCINGVEAEQLGTTEPDLNHPACKGVNQMLRGVFAEAMMSITEEPEQSERAMSVLAKDTERTELVMDLSESSICDTKFRLADTNLMGPNTLGQLILLQKLNLSFEYCTALADVKALGDGISKLESLRKLNLNFYYCTALTDVKALGDGIGQLKSLLELNLRFARCKALTDVKALGDGIGQLKSLQQLNLNFTDCEALADVKAVGDGISQLKALEQLNLDLNRCGWVWGLDKLEEIKLRKELPNLQTYSVNTQGTGNPCCRSGKFLRRLEQACKGGLLSFPIAASVLVAVLAMWMYHSCTYACLSVAVTVAASAAQPRLPVNRYHFVHLCDRYHLCSHRQSWAITCAIGIISWVTCFGGFALFALASLGLAYVTWNPWRSFGSMAYVSKSDRGCTPRYMHCSILLLAIVATVCCIANIRIAAIISSAATACLSLILLYNIAVTIETDDDGRMMADQRDALGWPFLISIVSMVTVVTMSVYEGYSHVGGFALFGLPAFALWAIPLLHVTSGPHGPAVLVELLVEPNVLSKAHYLYCNTLFVWIVQTLCCIANMRMAAILSSLAIACLCFKLHYLYLESKQHAIIHSRWRIRDNAMCTLGIAVGMGVYEGYSHVGGFPLFGLPAFALCTFLALWLVEEGNMPSMTRYLYYSILFVCNIQTLCSIANMRMAAIMSSLATACLSLAIFYRTAVSFPLDVRGKLKLPFWVTFFSLGIAVAMGVYEACSHHVGGFPLFGLPAFALCFYLAFWLIDQFIAHAIYDSLPPTTRYLYYSILFVWIIQTLCIIANMKVAAIMSSLAIACLHQAVYSAGGAFSRSLFVNYNEYGEAQDADGYHEHDEGPLDKYKSFTYTSIGFAVTMVVYTVCSHVYTGYWV